MHPAEPDTVASAVNSAVTSVPFNTLDTASPDAIVVSVHVVPTSGSATGGTSSSNVRSIPSPCSVSFPSTPKPVTAPSASRYALSSAISSGSHAISVTAKPSNDSEPSSPAS